MFWLISTFITATPGLDVRWSAPDGCSQEALETRVSQLVPKGRELKASVTIERVEQTYRLTLSTDSGQRTLEGAQCSEVTNGAALILAMLLDERREQAEQKPPAREVIAVPVPQRAPEEQPTWFGFIRASAVVDIGGVPVPTPGMRLTGGAGRGLFVGELSVATFLSQTVPIPQLVSGSAELTLEFEVLARGCARVWTARIEPRGCVGLSVGQLRGSGIGIVMARSQTSVLATALAGIGLMWRAFERLAVVVQADLGLSLARSTFALDGQAPIFTTPWVVMRGEAGLEWRFP